MKNLTNYIQESLAPNYFISKCVLCDQEMSDYLLTTVPIMSLSNSKLERMNQLLSTQQLDEFTLIWNNLEKLTPEEMVIGQFIQLDSGNIAISTQKPIPMPDNEVSKYSDILNTFTIKNFYLTTDDKNYTNGKVDINYLSDFKVMKKSMI